MYLENKFPLIFLNKKKETETGKLNLSVWWFNYNKKKQINFNKGNLIKPSTFILDRDMHTYLKFWEWGNSIDLRFNFLPQNSFFKKQVFLYLSKTKNPTIFLYFGESSWSPTEVKKIAEKKKKLLKKYRYIRKMYLLIKKFKHRTNKSSIKLFYKKILITTKYFRLFLFPKYRLKTWKTLLKGFNFKTNINFSSFYWYLHYRLDHFLLKFRYLTRFELINIIKSGSLFINFNKISNYKVYLPMNNVIIQIHPLIFFFMFKKSYKRLRLKFAHFLFKDSKSFTRYKDWLSVQYWEMQNKKRLRQVKLKTKKIHKIFIKKKIMVPLLSQKLLNKKPRKLILKKKGSFWIHSWSIKLKWVRIFLKILANNTKLTLWPIIFRYMRQKYSQNVKGWVRRNLYFFRTQFINKVLVSNSFTYIPFRNIRVPFLTLNKKKKTSLYLNKLWKTRHHNFLTKDRIEDFLINNFSSSVGIEKDRWELFLNPKLKFANTYSEYDSKTQTYFILGNAFLKKTKVNGRRIKKQEYRFLYNHRFFF
jgi:hypothetical protein